MKAALLALVLLSLSVGRAGASGLPSTADVTDGVSIHVHVYPSNSERDMIQAAGCKFIRSDLLWDVVEQATGQYNWNSVLGFRTTRGPATPRHAAYACCTM